jgi:plasmid stabilization system protein ParE
MPVLNIDVHPDVYKELEDSRSWYEEHAENLGTEFLDEIDRAVDAIQNAPTVWPWYDEQHHVRRFLVHRFPYAIIYRVTSSVVQIIGVMHLRRHPDYWKERMAYWSDK